MDTISRENNSMLPVAGIVVGVLALGLSLYALVSVTNLKKTVAADEAKLSQIPDDIASQVSTLQSSKADKATLDSVTAQTKQAFNDVGNAIGTLQEDIKQLKESQTRPAMGGKGKHGIGGPVVAGPGEYVVKSGDTLSKIARANGCTLGELKAVNPGADTKHLKIGQKLKLPEKASAPASDTSAPAPAPAPAP